MLLCRLPHPCHSSVQAQAAQALGLDPVMTGIAGNVLQQQSANYLQKGQAFVQSRMGFLSSSILHYHFNISTEYGSPQFYIANSRPLTS